MPAPCTIWIFSSSVICAITRSARSSGDRSFRTSHARVSAFGGAAICAPKQLPSNAATTVTRAYSLFFKLVFIQFTLYRYALYLSL